MLLISTRSGNELFRPAEAIIRGLADDGGLFVPTEFPPLEFDFSTVVKPDYKEIAFKVISHFFDDFSEEELKNAILRAYDEKFDISDIVDIKNYDPVFILELFHGPTYAFKDMALSLLPHLMVKAKEKLSITEDVVILAATSGDTGKAALAGFANVPGTKIIVFYPQDGVSNIQKLQMITQEGDNTFVIGVDGNFDDAQTGVKKIFQDKDIKEIFNNKKIILSSANSINIGRLIPQVVYYYYTYAKMLYDGVIKHGEEINFVVPTGNFGNILAGYYAKKIGLPIKRLLCASNENNVLYDFIMSGNYNRNRPFYKTMSPSMDILISSNLERLLYDVTEKQVTVSELINNLNSAGSYDIPSIAKDRIQQYFDAAWSDEDDTKETIKTVFEHDGYLMDTHTAVAYHAYQDYRRATGDDIKTVILSTASPYKFSSSVADALGKTSITNDEFDDIDFLARKSGSLVPSGIACLKDRPIIHKTLCKKDEMKEQVIQMLT